jgi:hypothetical protein
MKKKKFQQLKKIKILKNVCDEEEKTETIEP